MVGRAAGEALSGETLGVLMMSFLPVKVSDKSWRGRAFWWEGFPN